MVSSGARSGASWLRSKWSASERLEKRYVAMRYQKWPLSSFAESVSKSASQSVSQSVSRSVRTTTATCGTFAKMRQPFSWAPGYIFLSVMSTGSAPAIESAGS